MALIAVMCCIGSCTTTKYVPVNQVRHDVEYRNCVLHDSIYIYDSARVVNDTVYISRYEYNGSIKKDTIYINTTDSVPYPVEVTITKEVVPTWSWWSLGVNIMAIVAIILYIMYKIRRLFSFS